MSYLISFLQPVAEHALDDVSVLGYTTKCARVGERAPAANTPSNPSQMERGHQNCPPFQWKGENQFRSNSGHFHLAVSKLAALARKTNVLTLYRSHPVASTTPSSAAFLLESLNYSKARVL